MKRLGIAILAQAKPYQQTHGIMSGWITYGIFPSQK